MTNPLEQTAKDVAQWNVDQAEYGMDQTTLQADLQELATLMASHNSFAAFMLCINKIFPDVSTVQQDKINTQADAENIATDLRTFVTDAQNIVNQAPNITAAQGQQLQWYINTLNTLLSGNNLPMVDSVTKANMQNSINDFINQFNVNHSDDWTEPTGGAVAGDLNEWATPPVNQGGNNPGGPSPEFKSIMNDLQTLNQSTSGLSTTVQTTLQFYVNNYNQWIGIFNNALQDDIKEISAPINNQKSN
jgi:hypothetical protein